MLKSFIGPFIATFFISMFVLVMQFLWRMIDELVGKGLDFSVIAELLFYVSITMVPMALPLAVLLSSIMTFGNLGENYELVALKASGISLFKIMKPLVVFIVLLTGMAFVFANDVLPYANLKMYSLLYDVQRQKPELSFKEGIFTNDLEGYSIKVDRIDKNTGMMYNMLIYSHKDGNGNYEVTKADSGMMVSDVRANMMVLTLYNGHRYIDEGIKDLKNRNTFPFRRFKFGEQTITIALPGNDLNRTEESRWDSHSKMLSIDQLEQMIDSVQSGVDVKKNKETRQLLTSSYQRSKNRDKNRDSVLIEQSRGIYGNIDSLYLTFDPDEQQRVATNALQYAREVNQKKQNEYYYYKAKREQVIKNKLEWHRKFSLSFACFIFFFIAAPLGAIIRKGGLGMPLIVSVLLFIFYYIISMMGERSAKEAVLTPVMGMWLSAFVLLPLGIVLTYKSVTDSGMMSMDSYVKFFKKIKSFFKKEK